MYFTLPVPYSWFLPLCFIDCKNVAQFFLFLLVSTTLGMLVPALSSPASLILPAPFPPKSPPPCSLPQNWGGEGENETVDLHSTLVWGCRPMHSEKCLLNWPNQTLTGIEESESFSWGRMLGLTSVALKIHPSLLAHPC